MRKLISILLLAVMMVSLLTGCCLSHNWQEATCTTPKVCEKCGKAEGDALGHNWKDVNFFGRKECINCGEMDIAASLPTLASEFNATYNSDTNELVIETGPIGNEYKSYREFVLDNAYDSLSDTFSNITMIGTALGLTWDQTESLTKVTESYGIKTMTVSYSVANQTLFVTAEYTAKDGLRVTFCVK